MIEATVEKLISMKLHGMAEAVQEQMKNRVYKDLSFEERLGMLVDREMDHRQDRKLRTLLTKARFRYPGASVEDINFRALPESARHILPVLLETAPAGRA